MDRVMANFEGDSPVLQAIGQYGYKIYDEAELILMYIHLLTAALFPIYIGSHASLRRPPGELCKSPKKAPFSSSAGLEDDDDDDDEPEENNVEGLQPSDAIMFPILAGFTLGGLYFLITWLDDPNILNRILGWYFSTIGVVGVGKLAADGLNVITTFIFPTVWAFGKDVYLVDPLLRQQFIAADTPFKADHGGPIHRKFTDKSSPLPGLISNLKFPDSASNFLWSARAVFTEHWIFRAYVHGVASIKGRVRMNDAIGYSLGLAAILVYNLNGKAWWLTNMMGFGFCYGTLQLMSATTFWTGSLVLMGLFIYDVIMVFYTPMMVSVATTLDVPIKLIFPGPKRGGMLGLGDVVLPGIMMALALRFDLYMFYLKKTRAISQGATKALTPRSGTVQTKFNFNDSKEDPETGKPIYYTPTGYQGERFWTAPSIFALLPWPLCLLSPNPAKDIPDSIRGGSFPKPYFTASIAGYVTGMLVTLFVLNAYNHAQPALLYLVPGVLGALWGTGLIRGEHKDMWNYSEDGGLSSEQKNPKTMSEDESLKAKDKSVERASLTKEHNDKSETEKGKAAKRAEEYANHVFLISLTKPKVKAGLAMDEQSS